MFLKVNETESTANETTANETLSKNETIDNKQKVTENQTQTTNATANDTQTEPKKEIKIKTLKEAIEAVVQILDLPPLSDEVLKQSKEKLQELNDKLVNN